MKQPESGNYDLFRTNASVLVLKRDQGVAGAAFSYEMLAIGRRDTNTIAVQNHVSINTIDHKLDERQRAVVGDLEVIFSYPIRSLKQQGMDVSPVGEIIGVVNIDSQRPLEEWHRDDPDVAKQIARDILPDLSTCVSYIIE